MGKNQFQGTQMALHSSTSVSKRYRKSVFLSSIPIIFITFLSLSSKPACNCSGSILRLHSTEVTISLVMYCTYNPKNIQNNHGLSIGVFLCGPLKKLRCVPERWFVFGWAACHSSYIHWPVPFYSGCSLLSGQCRCALENTEQQAMHYRQNKHWLCFSWWNNLLLMKGTRLDTELPTLLSWQVCKPNQLGF